METIRTLDKRIVPGSDGIPENSIRGFAIFLDLFRLCNQHQLLVRKTPLTRFAL
jgi:hypothetical protein